MSYKPTTQVNSFKESFDFKNGINASGSGSSHTKGKKFIICPKVNSQLVKNSYNSGFMVS